VVAEEPLLCCAKDELALAAGGAPPTLFSVSAPARPPSLGAPVCVCFVRGDWWVREEAVPPMCYHGMCRSRERPPTHLSLAVATFCVGGRGW
jgi:hypothetical protein